MVLRRVGSCGVRTHMARQEFARGRSQWCGGAGAWHITVRHRMDMALQHRDMGIIVKFGEALACVKSPVSRTPGTIYVVT